MHPKDADGMANSVDPDQTVPIHRICMVDTIRVFQYTHTLSKLGIDIAADNLECSDQVYRKNSKYWDTQLP